MGIRSIVKRVSKKLFSLSKAVEPPSTKMVPVGKYLLHTTWGDKIDEYLSVFPNYSVNFARMSSWITQQGISPSSIILDVGANIGDTVALLRTFDVENPIICVEGSDEYFAFLESNSCIFKNITLIKSFLGHSSQLIKGKLLTEKGTGRIENSSNGDELQIETIDNLFANRLAKVRILKVDTDGYDVNVLNGAKKVISEDRPVIFFEYFPSINVSEQTCIDLLFSLSEDLGYQKAIFYDNYGRMLMPLNLEDKETITFLDRYVQQNTGAFPYFDVAVFHCSDTSIADYVISMEMKLF